MLADAVPFSEVWRGDFCEAIHSGHAVICDTSGQIVESWGDPNLTYLPRSSVKMIQALPLVESGAADAAGLSARQIAFACASHAGDTYHAEAARGWLGDLGLGDDDLICGPQEPLGHEPRNALLRSGDPICRVHNNCSGKHCGMLTHAKHIRADLNYVDPAHPTQMAIKDAFSDLTGHEVNAYGIDGCSAPNYAVNLTGIARAMAFFAQAGQGGSVRDAAAARIWQAMAAHPEMVFGHGEACTEFMKALGGKGAVKGGAEGCYVAILPELGLGIALKIEDGAKRAQEAAMGALLVHVGALSADHPAAQKWRNPVLKNFAGQEVGTIRPAPGFPA